MRSFQARPACGARIGVAVHPLCSREQTGREYQAHATERVHVCL